MATTRIDHPVDQPRSPLDFPVEGHVERDVAQTTDDGVCFEGQLDMPSVLVTTRRALELPSKEGWVAQWVLASVGTGEEGLECRDILFRTVSDAHAHVSTRLRVWLAPELVSRQVSEASSLNCAPERLALPKEPEESRSLPTEKDSGSTDYRSAASKVLRAADFRLE